MSVSVVIATGVIFIVGIIVMLVLAWKRDIKWFWIGSCAAVIIGQILMGVYFGHCATALQEALTETAQNELYNTEIIIGLFFCMFVGFFIITTALLIGNRLINKEKEENMYSSY